MTAAFKGQSARSAIDKSKVDGRKHIASKELEVSGMHWVFNEIAKGGFCL
ncbi:hypothetical protein FM107_19695 [Sphingobacterium sp. JB170]|nr:hypothetical protein FM107_19695 [Sphingobacterium sp. JB170]